MIIEMREKALDLQVRKIERLKKTAEFGELEKMIVPFLTDGPAFPKTREETYEELAEFLDEEEARAAAEEERPDAVGTTWKGFELTYAIDWGREMPQVRTLGFFTREMMRRTGATAEKLRVAAAKNLRATRVAARGATLFGTKVVAIAADTLCVPSWACSVVMSDGALSAAAKAIGRESVTVAPLFRDATIVAPPELRATAAELAEEFERITKTPWEPFTDRVFRYDVGIGLVEI